MFVFVSVTNRTRFPRGRAICRRRFPLLLPQNDGMKRSRNPSESQRGANAHAALLLSPELFVSSDVLTVTPPKESAPFQNHNRGCVCCRLKPPPSIVISQRHADPGSIFDLPEQPVAELLFLLFTFPAAALTGGFSSHHHQRHWRLTLSSNAE